MGKLWTAIPLLCTGPSRGPSLLLVATFGRPPLALAMEVVSRYVSFTSSPEQSQGLE